MGRPPSNGGPAFRFVQSEVKWHLLHELQQSTSTAAASSFSPRYPEMIMATIEALNDSNGSSKSEIVKHIESTYRDLSKSHAALLAHHLNKMKDTGEPSIAQE
ncbi:hypothetical protein ACFX15_006197 [Malus domestica]